MIFEPERAGAIAVRPGAEVLIEDAAGVLLLDPAYQQAFEREDGKSMIVVEYGDFYTEK